LATESASSINQQRRANANIRPVFTFSSRCLDVFVLVEEYPINDAFSVENRRMRTDKLGEPVEHPDYLSFLMRLWRVVEDGESQGAKGTAWRASLESAQTGATVGLANLEDLFAFLRAQTGHTQEPGRDEDEQDSTAPR
jgi:hypothetical protein